MISNTNEGSVNVSLNITDLRTILSSLALTLSALDKTKQSAAKSGSISLDYADMELLFNRIENLIERLRKKA